jgi:hypothetical protein
MADIQERLLAEGEAIHHRHHEREQEDGGDLKEPHDGACIGSANCGATTKEGHGATSLR